MGKASKGTWTEEDEKSKTKTLDDALKFSPSFSVY